MNFEQFDKYLAQLKEVLGQAADTVIRGVFAMNLSTVLLAVAALVIMVMAANKAKAIWNNGKPKGQHEYPTMDEMLIMGWAILSFASGLLGVLNLTQNLWKIFAPDFAAVDYILKLISKG